jgi:uncharacterized protein YggE
MTSGEGHSLCPPVQAALNTTVNQSRLRNSQSLSILNYNSSLHLEKIPSRQVSKMTLQTEQISGQQ